MTLLAARTRGFTIIEIIIASVVFVVGFLGAIYLIETSQKSAERSRSEIILANLSRERIELIKNLRDSNWLTSQSWTGSTQPWMSSTSTLNGLSASGTYTIEMLSDGSLAVKEIASLDTLEAVQNELSSNGQKTRLYRTAGGLYTHDESAGVATPYSLWMRTTPLQPYGETAPLEEALKIDIIAAFRSRPNSPYVMSTIITNWKR